MALVNPLWQFRVLCCVIIGLQLGDAISTFAGLDTGYLSEKNSLVLGAADMLHVPIRAAVVASKILVAGVFVLVLITKKSMPTKRENLVLFLMVIFYALVVQSNLYWLLAVPH